MYFSATGNCEYVAKQIAEYTQDNAVSVTDVKGEVKLEDGESLGIITPTYFWGLPSYMEDFFGGIKISGAENSYIYCIATYGTTTGKTDYFLNRLLKKQGFKLSASFGIKTVDNWTVLFEVTDKKEISKTLEGEALQLVGIIEQIKKKESVFISKDKKSVFMCTMARKFYNSARKTSHLHVQENCIGCGLCKNGCPIGAINIIDGKPRWVKDKCVMCFKCLHRCPEFAIHYDDKTQGKGQYIHP